MLNEQEKIGSKETNNSKRLALWPRRCKRKFAQQQLDYEFAEFSLMDIEIDPEQFVDESEIVRKFKSLGYPISKAALTTVSAFLAQFDSSIRSGLLTALTDLVVKVYHERKYTPKNLTASLLQELLESLTISGSEELQDKSLLNAVITINPVEYVLNKPNSKPDPSLFIAKPSSRVELYANRLKAVFSRCAYGELKNKYPGKEIIIGILVESQKMEGKVWTLINEQLTQTLEWHKPNLLNGLLIPGAIYLAIGQREDYGKLKNIFLIQPEFNKSSRIQRLSFKTKISYQLYGKTSTDRVLMHDANKNTSVLIIPYFDFSIEAHTNFNHIIDKLEPKPSLAILLTAEKMPKLIKFIRTDIQIYIVPHVKGPGPEIIPKIPLTSLYIGEGDGPRPIVLYNPARICIFGKQLLILASNIQQLLFKADTIKDQTKTLQEKRKSVAETIYYQGHLNPIDNVLQPEFPALDEYLSFIKQPHAIVLGDNLADPQCVRIKDTDMVFPGNFQEHQSFVVYYPLADAGMQWQFSSLRGN